VTGIEVEGDGPGYLFPWPMPAASMNESRMHFASQYRKYRWVMGSTRSGSQVRSRPSARTS
jgi:hypothetical protein